MVSIKLAKKHERQAIKEYSEILNDEKDHLRRLNRIKRGDEPGWDPVVSPRPGPSMAYPKYDTLKGFMRGHGRASKKLRELMKCDYCHKAIRGKFISTGKNIYHRQCYRKVLRRYNKLGR